jgi:hypothetical protein
MMVARRLIWIHDRPLEHLTTWGGGYYRAWLKNVGLSGADGMLSFSKSFGVAVLIAYTLGVRLPASVAITLIISAHGTKVLLEAIKRGVFNVSSSSADAFNRSESRSTSEEKIDVTLERKGWNAEREFQES